MQDAAPQGADVESTPQIEHGDAPRGTRADNDSTPRLPRKERRRNFWKPIQDKIVNKRQQKAKLDETSPGRSPCGGSDVVGRGFQQEHGQEISDTYLQNRTKGQPEGHGVVHAQGTRGFYRNPLIHGLRSASEGYDACSQEASQELLAIPTNILPKPSSSNAGCIEGSGGIVHTQLPPPYRCADEQTQVLEARSCSAMSNPGTGADGDNARLLVAIPSDFWLPDRVLPIPSTPSTYKEFIDNEDLGSTVEQPSPQAVMPDHESSTRVPRIQVEDWETETKITSSQPYKLAQFCEGNDFVDPENFIKRKKLMKDYEDNGLDFFVRAVRSQTAPPDVMSSVSVSIPVASFIMNSDANSFQWTDCDTTVVDEPQELSAEESATSDMPFSGDVSKRPERFFMGDHNESREPRMRWNTY